MIESVIELIYRSLIYILPAYIANASPTILGGGTPVDLGKNFIDGRRIFGDHKTIRGVISGIVMGTLTGPFLYLIGLEPDITNSFLRALLLSIGTHIGDLTGSFIKRRINLKPGESAPILDQLGFLIFALILSTPIYPIDISMAIALIVMTLILHPITNLIAYKAKIQEAPL